MDIHFDAATRQVDTLTQLTRDCLHRLVLFVSHSHLADHERAILQTKLAEFKYWIASVNALEATDGRLGRRLQALALPSTERLVFGLLRSLRACISNCHQALEATRLVGNVLHTSSSEKASECLAAARDCVSGCVEQLRNLTEPISSSVHWLYRRQADDMFDKSLHQPLEAYLTLLVFSPNPGSSLEECRSRMRKQQASISSLDGLAITEVQRRLIKANLRRQNRQIYRYRQTLFQASAGNQESFWLIPALHDRVSPVFRTLFRAGKTEDLPRLHIPYKLHEFSYYRHGQEFVCSNCFTSQCSEVAEPELWNHHLAIDLQPYVCVLPHCPDPDLMFTSRAEWVDHMEMDHKPDKMWECPFSDTHPTFSTRLDIKEHFMEQHFSQISDFDMFVDSCLVDAPMEIQSCPLCPVTLDKKGGAAPTNMIDHVADHICSFSMLSLLSERASKSYDPDRDQGVKNRVYQWLDTTHSAVGRVTFTPEEVGDDPSLELYRSIGSDGFADDIERSQCHDLVMSFQQFVHGQSFAIKDNERIQPEITLLYTVSPQDNDGQSTQILTSRATASRSDESIGVANMDDDIVAAAKDRDITRLEHLLKAIRKMKSSSHTASGTERVDDIALRAATQYGHTNVVRILLDSGVHPETRGGFQETSPRSVSSDVDNSSVSMQGDQGGVSRLLSGTPLQIASQNGHESVVRLLIDRGAHVNARGDYYYGTALQAAVRGGYEAIVLLLLRNGAEINAQGGFYGSALHAAAALGVDHSILRLLLEYDAAVDLVAGFYGTALQAAARGGHLSTVKTLLCHEPQRYNIVNLRGGMFCTAIQAAAQGGFESIVQVLLAYGADINIQGGYYGTALQAAIHTGHDSIAHLLIQHKANVNAQGGHYGSALVAAAQGGHNYVVRLLLSNGADINLGGSCYGTALQAAARKGLKSTVRLLLDKYIDPNAASGQSNAALQIAASHGNDEIVKLLLDHGADVNAGSAEDDNALDAASRGQHTSTVHLLQEHGAIASSQMGRYHGARVGSSWTAFPSLLSTLPSQQRQVLEEVACAYQCGRFKEADKVLSNCLPDSYTVPILALQHADGLALSGRERERIVVLNNALLWLPFPELNLPGLSLLLKVMLAEAELLCMGRITDAGELFESVRAHFSARGPHDLSDIEIRCLVQYYELVWRLQQVSNIIGDDDDTIFENDDGVKIHESKSRELDIVLQDLISEQRWRLASTLMQLLLKHTDGAAIEKSALDLCHTLERIPHPGVRFRSILVKRMLARRKSSIHHYRSASLQTECVQLLRKMTVPPHTTWVDFCPWIARRIPAESDEANLSLGERIKLLRDFAAKAERECDYVFANEVYIRIRDALTEALPDVQDGSNHSLILNDLRASQMSGKNFHRNTTRSLLFYATWTVDLLTNLYTWEEDYTTVVQLVERFEVEYPFFAVPSLQKQIYVCAMNSARRLGLSDKFKSFTHKYQDWAQRCPYSDPDSSPGIKSAPSPVYILREISLDCDSASDPTVCGTVGMRCLLRWARRDIEWEVMSDKEFELLFQGFLVHTQASDQIEPSIFGQNGSFMPSRVFLAQYERLLKWVVPRYWLPSQHESMTATRDILHCRLYRIAKHGFSNSIWPVDKEVDYAAELQKLNELGASGFQEKPNGDRHITIARRISINLMDSLASEHLVTQAEVRKSLIDCQESIDYFRSNGELVKEYHSCIQMIILTSTLSSLFSTPRYVDTLTLIDRAEDLSTQINNAMISHEEAAFDTKFQSSLCSEHHDYALLQTIKAFEMRLSSANRHGSLETSHLESINQYRDTFLKWCFRSKSTSFSASATEMARALRYYSDKQSQQYSTTANDQPDLLPWLATNLLETNVKEQVNLELMLESLPANVAILDFVCIKLGTPSGYVISILHQKGSPAAVTKMTTITSHIIDKWVLDNLENMQEQSTSVVAADNFMKNLGELEELLKAVTSIPEGTTILICPTKSLARVPIHAIHFKGAPLIARYPVVYCQSLQILLRLWIRARFEKTPLTTAARETMSIDRMTASHFTDNVKAENLSLIEGASQFHFNGEIVYNSNSIMDSYLLLNKPRKEDISEPRKVGWNHVSARDLFNIKMREPALATILACKNSGHSNPTTNALMAFPTAFFLAGAGAVVSTLYPNSYMDNALLIDGLHAALYESNSTTSHLDGAEWLDNTVNVAEAVRMAVLKHREQESRIGRGTHSWASFVLNGFWMLPRDMFPL